MIGYVPSKLLVLEIITCVPGYIPCGLSKTIVTCEDGAAPFEDAFQGRSEFDPPGIPKLFEVFIPPGMCALSKISPPYTEEVPKFTSSPLTTPFAA